MLEADPELIKKFQDIHSNYEKDRKKYKKQFDEVGEQLLDHTREWENKLCAQSEKGGYGVFTTKLAEKFQNELRTTFPLIDEVGLEEVEIKPQFQIKKISLK